jgi:hypothetical protein
MKGLVELAVRLLVVGFGSKSTVPEKYPPMIKLL